MSLKISRMFLIFIVTILLIFSLRLGYLLYGDDSRTNLIHWMEFNIPYSSKVLVYARLTRLPSIPDAIAEQKEIDPKSLRKIDIAEENLPVSRGWHALNLYSIENEQWYGSIEQYSRERRYQYLFTSLIDFEKNLIHFNHIQNIASKGVLMKSFGNSQENYSPSVGQLSGTPLGLFMLKEFGPLVALYKLY